MRSLSHRIFISPRLGTVRSVKANEKENDSGRTKTILTSSVHGGEHWRTVGQICLRESAVDFKSPASSRIRSMSMGKPPSFKFFEKNLILQSTKIVFSNAA